MAKILIVEDNQGTNKAICEYMKEAGHTLFSAFTGSEALKIFRGEELDIIVLDIMLPEMSGILEGKMVGKRASSSDDQLFFSMPDNAQPEQYQTFVFDGNTYKSIGPFDTEEELFNALKDYTDAEVEAGTMTQTEATALLEKYQ
jgi:CheY-like chemotaxis protein